MKKLKILIVSSEMVPFIKAGGLGDVAGTLPLYLKKLGHDVRVVIPKYSSINLDSYEVKAAVSPMGVWMGTNQEWCSVVETRTENDIPVYMVEHNGFFDRWGLYHDQDMNDYLDNSKRYGFFSRAALQLCKDISFSPDIVHAHDWQSALVPAYLKIWDFDCPVLGKTSSVLTIHNAAYQGTYPDGDYEYLGLNWHNFTEAKFECFGSVNFLKGGIHYADMVNTVSHGYADEIKSPYGGSGLAPYLSNKGDNFWGILNGVDYNDWSPEKDKFIPANYSINDMAGKAICKKELQKRFLLEEDDHIAVIGVVGRFVEQKGYHLLAETINGIVSNMHAQVVILGSGENGLEHYFGNLPKGFPGKVGSYIGFNNELAHLIEAGADFFLMPSIYEPCGLNQLYSLKYGTLPIVRATGGLNDTVHNYNEVSGEGTGFKFWEPSARALYYAVGWAMSTYYDRPEHMKKMVKEAMSEDYSWEKSTREYEKIYERAISNKKSYDRNFI